MTAIDVTVWTCDRCGNQARTLHTRSSRGALPEGWRAVGGVSHLCRMCTRAEASA